MGDLTPNLNATATATPTPLEVVPVLPESTPENERFVVTEAWKHSDFLCKNYILSGLEDNLYNVYSNVGTSKELWDALEKKYKTEDAGLKKLIAVKFLDYKMVDGKSIDTQVQKLHVIIHDLLAEGLVISDEFQVAAVIEKLPPSWNNNNKGLQKLLETQAKGDDTGRSHRLRKKASGLRNYPNKKKFKGNCHNCGKIGHKDTDCRASKKDKKKGQANMVETNEEVYDLCAMLSECNLVGNLKE
ncbi:uncharacterized protein LOC132624313 [Lycium barbarum]|uniref:uncharacterized protein LOC132624313 n=1 Tax=Lycium barbarum TaxID=112863 RepID=UPI00293EE2AD|nr:uncharacterized protein LOC132624313 [Lycium barbarum]